MRSTGVKEGVGRDRERELDIGEEKYDGPLREGSRAGVAGQLGIAAGWCELGSK